MIDESYGASLHAFRLAVLRSLREVQLTQLKGGFSHEQLVPLATYAPWRDDVNFIASYENIKKHTLVDLYRCYELWDLARQLRALEGDTLEVGVWRGGTAAILGKAGLGSQSGHLWLADTFEGVPKAGWEDTLYKGGEHTDTSEGMVRELLVGLGITNFTLLRGVFPDCTGQRLERTTFKLCHIDVDTYQSAMDVFTWVWPRMVVGGLVVFDDYGFWGCEGVARAVNYLRSHGVHVIYNLNGHALVYRLVKDN